MSDASRRLLADGFGKTRKYKHITYSVHTYFIQDADITGHIKHTKLQKAS